MKTVYARMTRYDSETFCSIRNQYYIDVIETEETYEAWIMRKDYGIAQLMFGASVKDTSFGDFIDLIYWNFPACADAYDEIVED